MEETSNLLLDACFTTGFDKCVKLAFVAEVTAGRYEKYENITQSITAVKIHDLRVIRRNSLLDQQKKQK